MKKTKLKFKAMNKRANEVFDLKNNETVWDIYIDDLGNVRVTLDDGETEWDYIPDMSNRPQALAYLMGERNTFND